MNLTLYIVLKKKNKIEIFFGYSLKVSEYKKYICSEFEIISNLNYIF